MIVKSISRKGTKRSTVTQLLNYMLQEHKQSDFLLLHNITGNSIKEYTDAFMHNEKNRLYARGNSVLVYHEILSIHEFDTKYLTQQKLKGIAKQYIKERCPNALVVAVPHYNKQSIHLHLGISGININGRSSRISKAKLHEIKISLQQAFPELEHSMVQHGKKQRYITEKEYQLKKRKAPTEKEQITELLTRIYKQSYSKENFYKRIQDNGLQLYERNNNITGVFGKRKYRFSSLGFDEKKIGLLDAVLEFEKIRNTINDKNRDIKVNR